MDWKKRPIGSGAICGGIVGLLPALPVAFTFATFAIAEIRDRSILQFALAIGGSILYGGLFLLGGVICGAIVGALVSMIARK